MIQTLIEAPALYAQLDAPSTVILDCSYSLSDPSIGRQTYLRGHIPGAFFMDLGHNLSSPVIPGVTGRHPLPDPVALAFALRQAGVNSASQVVVYDQSNGMYAARAWWLLRWLGHTQVALLNGGLEEWKRREFALDNVWPAPEEGDLEINIQDHLVMTKEQVRVTHLRIIDSREQRRFTGEFEPIDPVAGHIPGAVCMPYQDNTDEAGIWRDTSFLKDKFKALSNAEEVPVFYCGSGVTACHNILAYALATGKEAKLYAGSWSEWLHYYPGAMGD